MSDTCQPEEVAIQLGFCEPITTNTESLISHRSPWYSTWDGGQVGGRPSWLEPKHLPRGPLLCGACDDVPLTFVAQLYAPLETPERAFHRSLYVFACAQCDDATRSVRVLRAQLAKKNEYYPSNGSNTDNKEEEEWVKHQPGHHHGEFLCAVCGLIAKGKCPLQGKVFCGAHHQKEYKKHVFDKSNKNDTALTILPSVHCMWELVVEDEPPETEIQLTSLSIKDADVQDDSDSDQELEQTDLNDIVGKKRNDVSQDPFAMAFYERIQGRPNVATQCLRYCRWKDDAVLWIQKQNQLQTKPPDCQYCGAARKFEFQLLPQMLHYLLKQQSSTTSTPNNYQSVKAAIEQADSWVAQAPPSHVPPALADAKDAAIANVQQQLLSRGMDYGTIVVYTCVNSCGGDNTGGVLGAYQDEFAYRQSSLDATNF
jgi:pre-rRNA-processing protein TSR4